MREAAASSTPASSRVSGTSDEFRWKLQKRGAFGLRAIDGPYGDFKDPEGYRAAARRAAALGYEGKWAIHPSQIALANDVFTPPAGEVERARRILHALDEAARQGRGAAQLDGRMIDAASARMAQNIVEIAAAIAARASPSPPLAATRV